MSVKKPLISVLIGSKDRPDSLIRCLQSVLAQTYTDYEILVFDDNSKESFAGYVRDKCPDNRIQFYRSETTLGVAGGRNVIIQKARGDYLLTLDDDAAFRDENALEKIPGFFKQYPDVGLFSFKIINIVDGKEAGYRVPLNRRLLKKSPEILDRTEYVSGFLGGGHVLKAEIFQKCGLYQEDFMFGFEELDLAYRIINHGYSIIYTPEIIVDHYPGILDPLTKMPDQVYSERMYFYTRNKIWINYKYLPWYAFLVNSTLWFIFRLVSNVNKGALGSVCRGCLNGILGLRYLQRMPLTIRAKKYLRDNHGRFYF